MIVIDNEILPKLAFFILQENVREMILKQTNRFICCNEYLDILDNNFSLLSIFLNDITGSFLEKKFNSNASLRATQAGGIRSAANVMNYLKSNVESSIMKELTKKDKDIAKEIQEKSHWLDNELGSLLGIRFCALKMWYPKDGYIAWHNNWNVPGYNVLFTYTETGNGYWRHINPEGSKGKINKPFDKHLVCLLYTSPSPRDS